MNEGDRREEYIRKVASAMKQTGPSRPPRELVRNHAADPLTHSITESVIRHAVQVAHECDAQALFVYADALSDPTPDLPDHGERRVIFATKTPEDAERQEKLGRHVIRVPEVRLTRSGQVKIAVLLALYRGLITENDTIVFLSGVADTGTLDTVSVLQVGHEFEMFLAPRAGYRLTDGIRPEILERVISIAVELGGEGREGKPVGALFVLGDSERVQSLSRQLILNPFRGYSSEDRNILDEQLKETVKELATIDGAFIIAQDGTIESAGTYLKITGQSSSELPPGLGTRHHAASAITDVSEAVAVVVSESTGAVTLFGKGRILAQIEQSKRETANPSRD